MKNFIPKILFYFSLFLVSHFSSAQTISPHLFPTCGISFIEETAVRERMFENRRNNNSLLKLAQFNRTGNSHSVYVPVQFHLLGTESGTGFIRKEEVLDALCYSNELYYKRPVDLAGDGIADDTLTVIFYLNNSMRYISNNILFNHSDPSIVSYLMGLNKVPAALNVFIGLTIPSSGGQGNTLAYYSGSTDCIYAIKSTINSSSATLAHEIGHYFSLAHPHFGWDGLDYTADPSVINNGCAPTMTTNGVLCEKVARTGGSENCQIAADGFCDTKADYNFGIFSFCSNNIPANDPDCVPLPQPNTDNVMSYFNDACTDNFSPEQIKAVYLDLVSRGYIFNTPSGTIPISASPLLVYPIDSQISFYPNAIHLDWNSVYGATSYMVSAYEYLLGIQTQMVTQQIVNTTDAWFVGLPNRVYGWKVKPLGNIDLCNNFESDIEFFITADWALKTGKIEEASSFKSIISPNPIVSGQALKINIKLEQAINLQIKITNALGQLLVPPKQLQAIAGQNNFEINTQNLIPGIYFIQLDSDNNSFTHKLLIQ